MRAHVYKIANHLGKALPSPLSAPGLADCTGPFTGFLYLVRIVLKALYHGFSPACTNRFHRILYVFEFRPSAVHILSGFF